MTTFSGTSCWPLYKDAIIYPVPLDLNNIIKVTFTTYCMKFYTIFGKIEFWKGRFYNIELCSWNANNITVWKKKNADMTRVSSRNNPYICIPRETMTKQYVRIIKSTPTVHWIERKQPSLLQHDDIDSFSGRYVLEGKWHDYLLYSLPWNLKKKIFLRHWGIDHPDTGSVCV